MKYKELMVFLVKINSENKESINNYWLNTVILKIMSCFQKRLMKLAIKNILRPSWKPLHLLPMFQSCPNQTKYRFFSSEEDS